MIKKIWPGFILIFISLIFFWQSFTKGFIPIPSDTIVGLYYPFRDFYAKEYPRGIPFKNFMVTDPVRQQYPWKYLSISLEKNLQIPLWNPYTFSGQPLMGNLQSGTLYPINLIFFVLPFEAAWSFYIFLEPILAGIFMYLYLKNLNLNNRSAAFGSIAFSFSGFFVSWLEWGTVLHTALWLPLIFLTIDKLTANIKDRVLNKWNLVLMLALSFSFLSGHLQIFFYSFLISIFYLILRFTDLKNKKSVLISFLISFFLFALITLPVWFEGLKFISLSGRSLDQDYRTIAGWFIPWQNAIQVLIPDFFGNPATLNYNGVWNYGEFVSYIGVGALIFALFSVFRKDKNTIFFLLAIFIACIFAFPTIIAKIPFKFGFPFISTSQPTRLVFIVDFSLSILAALGFDYFIKNIKNKKLIFVLLTIALLFILIWIYVLANLKSGSGINFQVAKSNLFLPTALFVINSFVIFLMLFFKKSQKTFYGLSLLIILILALDLLRFAGKYTPFASANYLYPQTKTIEYLKKNLGNYRIMASDSRILPPNFSIMYKIQTIDGYDPLYLQRYAEFSAALERGTPDIHAPFGFNRIITPQNYHSRVIDLLGVKYVLTFDELDKRNFAKVFQEGDTKIFLNKNVLPRAFFVNSLHISKSKQESIDYIYKNIYDLGSTAVVEESVKTNWTKNKFSIAKISKYSENYISIKTKNSGDSFLVLTDNFYPTWKATIDGKPTKIYLTDFTFRGIEVPKGNHTVLFYNTF